MSEDGERSRQIDLCVKIDGLAIKMRGHGFLKHPVEWIDLTDHFNPYLGIIELALKKTSFLESKDVDLSVETLEKFLLKLENKLKREIAIPITIKKKNSWW